MKIEILAAPDSESLTKAVNAFVKGKYVLKTDFAIRNDGVLFAAISYIAK